MSKRLPRAAGPTFVIAGILHFITPKTYESIMPDYLPAHRELVYASGVAEAAGGLGLLASSATIRKWSAYWLVATLVAVFPANLQMALNPEKYKDIPPAALWARLPLQLAFIRWVLAAAKRAD
ncbi:DoxX family protein [Baekduia sp. Peel2402]|uniref:DoxX family protein n=1 Tax=Baekduia sp. Peel2402 TaxID=3458296 RepID=UPI00403EBAD5